MGASIIDCKPTNATSSSVSYQAPHLNFGKFFGPFLPRTLTPQQIIFALFHSLLNYIGNDPANAISRVPLEDVYLLVNNFRIPRGHDFRQRCFKITFKNNNLNTYFSDFFYLNILK